MAGETTGWGGEFWLHNGTSLIELVGVKSVSAPSVKVDLLETSHLKSPGKYKEFIGGMKDGAEFTVEMNYVARSATDLLCEAQLTQTRAFKIVEPDFDGAGVQDIDGTAVVIGYEPNPMQPNEVRTATLTLKLSGAPTKSAS